MSGAASYQAPSAPAAAHSLRMDEVRATIVRIAEREESHKVVDAVWPLYPHLSRQEIVEIYPGDVGALADNLLTLYGAPRTASTQPRAAPPNEAARPLSKPPEPVAPVPVAAQADAHVVDWLHSVTTCWPKVPVTAAQLDEAVREDAVSVFVRNVFQLPGGQALKAAARITSAFKEGRGPSKEPPAMAASSPRHPAAPKGDAGEEDGQEPTCPVCFEPLHAGAPTLNCRPKHQMCAKCLREHIQTCAAKGVAPTCPCCARIDKGKEEAHP